MKNWIFMLVYLTFGLMLGISACTKDEDDLCSRESFEGVWQGKFVTTAYRADSVHSETSYEAELDFKADGTVVLPAFFVREVRYDWYVQSDPSILILQFNMVATDNTGIQVLGGEDFVYKIEGCSSNVKTLRETRGADDQDPNDYYETTLALRK